MQREVNRIREELHLDPDMSIAEVIKTAGDMLEIDMTVPAISKDRMFQRRKGQAAQGEFEQIVNKDGQEYFEMPARKVATSRHSGSFGRQSNVRVHQFSENRDKERGERQSDA